MLLLVGRVAEFVAFLVSLDRRWVETGAMEGPLLMRLAPESCHERPLLSMWQVISRRNASWRPPGVWPCRSDLVYFRLRN